MMIFSTRGNNCFVQGQQLLSSVHRFRKSFTKKIPLSTGTTRSYRSKTTSFRNNNNEKQAMILQQQQRRRWNTNNTVGSGTSNGTSTSTIAMPTPKQLRIVAFRAAIPVSCGA
jgi:hypothetical protein